MVDQNLIVLNLYNIPINKILVTEFMAVKVPQYLNSMQKMSQRNQQHLGTSFQK